MERERILITVRTYPVPSAKYIETVCVGGISDHGEWRRLVPVPLRYLDGTRQFRTYDIVKVSTEPGSDGRPETRRPHTPSLRVVGHLNGWQARRDWVSPTELSSLAALRAQSRTLAPVRVSRVLHLVAKPCSTEWTRAQQEKLRQAQLFDERKPLEKMPFDFRVRWRDHDGEEHDSLVLAWEMLEAYRQYRRRYGDPIAAIRRKWLEDVWGASRRLSFFMGNLAQRRAVFCICGWFNPPREVAEHATLW